MDRAAVAKAKRIIEAEGRTMLGFLNDLLYIMTEEYPDTNGIYYHDDWEGGPSARFKPRQLSSIDLIREATKARQDQKNKVSFVDIPPPDAPDARYYLEMRSQSDLGLRDDRYPPLVQQILAARRWLVIESMGYYGQLLDQRYQINNGRGMIKSSFVDTSLILN